MKSIRDIYKIGKGPSSSHTIGPERAAKLFKADLEDAILASNANIGGPTTAAGMGISQGWTKLVGPALLVGVVG